MKAPLIIMSSCFAVGFFDGMFGWNLAEGFYVLVGLAQLASLIWMWIIESKS